MTPTKNPVVTIVMAPGLLRRIEDFRFNYRFQNRSQAITWLLEAAIKAGLKPE